MASRVYLRVLIGTARSALAAGCYASLCFLGAGTFHWPSGWLLVAIATGLAAVGSMTVNLTNPDLMEARAKGIRADTKSFDKLFYAMFLPILVIYPILAGIDVVRFGWSLLPAWTVAPGIALYAVAAGLTNWTLLANRHAETTVRIQEERGHKVITDGPYAYVRHPLYLGVLIGSPAIALLLGSAWSLIAAALMAALFIWRTGREDQTLKSELNGYAAYAKVTRFKLLPGLW